MSVCFSLPLQGHCAEVWCLAVSSNGGLVVRILYMHTNTQALSGMSVPGVRITWPLDEGVGAHTRATRTVWAARNCELNCGIYIVRHVRAYFGRSVRRFWISWQEGMGWIEWWEWGCPFSFTGNQPPLCRCLERKMRRLCCHQQDQRTPSAQWVCYKWLMFSPYLL